MTTTPKRVQRLRGTSAQLASVSGLVGETITNTDTHQLHVMDGITPGGHPLLRADGGDGSAVTVDGGRALSTRFGDRINVLDKGAVRGNDGDATANLIAFQAAINTAAASQKGVYIPPGNYNLTGTLLIPSFCSLCADHGATNSDTNLAHGGVKLVWSGDAAACLENANDSAALEFFTMSNITLLVNSGAVTWALDFRSMRQCSLDAVIVGNGGGGAFRSTGITGQISWVNWIKNCNFSTGASYAGYAVDIDFSDSWFTNNYINNGWGAVDRSWGGNMWIGNHCDNSSSDSDAAGLTLLRTEGSTSKSTTITGNYFDVNSNCGLMIWNDPQTTDTTGTFAATVVGNLFRNPSAQQIWMRSAVAVQGGVIGGNQFFDGSTPPGAVAIKQDVDWTGVTKGVNGFGPQFSADAVGLDVQSPIIAPALKSASGPISLVAASGTVSLDNATSNTVLFGTAGLGAPTYTTRSAGTKVVIYPSVDGTHVDYALGMETGGVWSSIGTADATRAFKWYAETSPVMSLDGAGTLRLPYAGATAVASNVVMDNADGNALLRSTSSAAYKKDVEDLDAALADALVSRARPIWYRSLAAADRPDWSWYGLIAEELAAIDPRLVHWRYRDEDMEEEVVVGTEEVTVPVTEVVEETAEVVEVVDGRAFLRRVTRQIERPVVDFLPVYLEDGAPYTRGGHPVIHSVPRTRTETRAIMGRRPKAGAQPVPDGVQYERLTVMLLSVLQRLVPRVETLESEEDQ